MCSHLANFLNQTSFPCTLFLKACDPHSLISEMSNYLSEVKVWRKSIEWNIFGRISLTLSGNNFGIKLTHWLPPVPAITGRDEPRPRCRPFFHLWRDPFWPKLASSILNFCWRKASFQWCPDQGDCPNGAQDMHKSASTPGCSIVKIPRLDDASLEVF